MNPGHQEHATPAQQLAITATFTAEPLEEPVNFWLQALGIDANVEFAEFDQVFQQLLDPGSLLNNNTSGINVILVRTQDWSGSHDETSATQNPAHCLQKNIDEFLSALQNASTQSNIPYLLCLCHESPAWQAKLVKDKELSDIRDQLIIKTRSLPGVSVITPDDIDTLYPVSEYYDAEQDKLASIPYTTLYYISLATLIMRNLYALITPDTKVIVLDCDNTLWNGVCGEDGAHGIDIDFASKALQEFMLTQKNNGILLCLCSKNNEQDVIDVFNHHKNMPLSLNDFVATRINWTPKSQNLESLSRELGLGLNSFVFIDDDPVECSEVETRCPLVNTLQLPRQRPLIAGFLKHAWLLDNFNVTREASNRHAMYRENAQRQSIQERTTSLEEFLGNLELSISILEMAADDIARVTELCSRTNQFNATTIRYSASEITQLLNNSEKSILVTRAKDRFGDYGLIGIAIYTFNDGALQVDSLLLSCRALGKRIEHEIMRKLANIAQGAACTSLIVPFITSKRNNLVLDFLETYKCTDKQAITGGVEYHYRVKDMI